MSTSDVQDTAKVKRFQRLYEQSGGVITSLLTTLMAFLIGGLVMLATVGANPLKVYKGIFEGAGLPWLLPWVEGEARAQAAFDLQQTLIRATTLALTGLAVAFAFRCGLFNIGGQGQWTVGAIVSVFVGAMWADLAGPVHIVLAITLATLAGALWGGIAGFLKAKTGAHEVITTIMLNWIALWVGSYFFGRGGPLQNTDPNQQAVPISDSVFEQAELPVFWGDAALQGLHVGFFIAIGALVAYWLILARTTLGFRVRAVGRNPEAARYGGISVGSSYFSAMAISGAFAGLGGAIDILGVLHRIGVNDVKFSTVGFIGIAVALLGRNTAVGTMFAALLFGALTYGTSTRSIDSSLFDPQLAGNLTLIIQALVLLFIGADVVILALWRARGGGFPKFHWPTRAPAATAVVVPRRKIELPSPGDLVRGLGDRLVGALPQGPRAVAYGGIGLAILAGFLAVPPITARSIAVPIIFGVGAAVLGTWAVTRGARRAGYGAIVLAVVGATCGILATQSSVENLDRVFVWSALVAASLRFATPLLFAALGGMFSERSGVVNIGLEGMMLMGAFFAILVADKSGSWIIGIGGALAAGAVIALIHAFVSIHLRADQIVSGVAINFLALGVTGYALINVYGGSGTPSGIAEVPNLHLAFLDPIPFFGDAFGDLNLLIWVSWAVLILAWVVMFRTPFGLRISATGEHPRAVDTVGLSVYRIRYTAVIISGMLAALGGAFLSIGFVHSFSENMTAGRGFIALAILIFGNWRPKGAFFGALLFGTMFALAPRLAVYSDSLAVLFNALPYVLTLIVVAGVIGRSIPPKAIGIPYIKR